MLSMQRLGQIPVDTSPQGFTTEGGGYVPFAPQSLVVPSIATPQPSDYNYSSSAFVGPTQPNAEVVQLPPSTMTASQALELLSTRPELATQPFVGPPAPLPSDYNYSSTAFVGPPAPAPTGICNAGYERVGGQCVPKAPGGDKGGLITSISDALSKGAAAYQGTLVKPGGQMLVGPGAARPAQVKSSSNDWLIAGGVGLAVLAVIAVIAMRK